MDFIAIVSTLTLILTSSARPIDEDHPYPTYNNPFAPSTVNFQDIYTNTFNRLAEEKTSPGDEEFPLNNIATQYVEFHPNVLKIARITPPPRVLLNASYLKKNTTNTSTTTITYTDEPEEPMKVIPIRNHQRGVLDILFPSPRVKSFKSVFDSFKRLLSYTLRKR